MNRMKVLFLCTGNSARSQMAEAFLREEGGYAFDAHSAGLEPKGLNPKTVQVMEEIGIDMSGHRSKDLDEYFGKAQFDYLITVCGHAEQNCPFFPGAGVRIHWPFDDPAAFEGTEGEKLEKFRETRDQIRAKVGEFVEEHFNHKVHKGHQDLPQRD